MNSHGGNVAAIEAVTHNLRLRWRMLAVHASWRRLGYPDGLFSAREMAHGVHGGDTETSLMLALRPEAVKTELARDFASASESMERDFALLRSKRRLVLLGWQAISIDGAVGEADRARAAKGEAAADYGVHRFIALLLDVSAFDLSCLGPGPLG